MEDFFSILFSIIISLGTFTASLFALHYFWLKPHSAQIPSNEEQPSSTLKSRIRNEDITTTVKSLKEMLYVYLPLITNLDTKYWVKNIGLDGYIYLYFQRQLIKMVILFLIVYCLFVIPVSFWYGKINVPQDPTEFILETSNARAKYHQELRSIIDCFLVYFISLYSIYTMFGIKKHVKDIIYEQNNSKDDREEFARMKARSVHVTGVFPEDRRGELLISEINSFLDMSGGGRIASSIIIHDFMKIVELENKRKSVDNAHKLYTVDEPSVKRICFPSKYRKEEYYKRKLKSIDDMIEAELMKPLLCSGHAFVCFDSIRTRNLCLEYFKEGTKSTLSTFWSLITNKVATSKNKKSARKVTSTFQKFDEEDMMRALKNKYMPIVMKPLSIPIDIFWANMGGGRGLFLLRRLIINAVGLLILIFLSTPASMLTAMKEIEILQFIDVSQYVPNDSGFGTFIKQILPPLMIISLNQLLLLLIDYAAYMEKHSTFTGCQISIFYKALFYLTLNMLIIPALTLATADSLFKMIVYEGNSVAEALKQFYFSSPGGFFIMILIQNGAFSSSFHMLRVAEILNSFGSTWLAHFQRNYINDTEKWRKQESDVFQYGYLYGQIVTAYAITISYSVSTPGVMLAGLAFLLMRYSVDGFNLLTVFKMEIDSGGKLIESILKYSTGGCLLLQVALAVSFWSSGYIVSFTLISLLFLITIYLCYKISKPISGEQENEVDDIEVNSHNQRELVQIWEAAYKHPLLVSPSEDVTANIKSASDVLAYE